MVNYICTRFKDSDGLDLGCHLIPKEYLLEKYPAIQEWVKAPALWGWGNNDYGKLGNNSTLDFSSPVQTISSGTNWRSVSTENTRASGIKTDGTLWNWGQNRNGGLGNNDIVNRSSPVQTVSGGTNWKAVSSSSHGSIALKTDGTLWGWGLNAYGQLGNNNRINSSSPIQTISSGTNWKSINAILFSSFAIKTDGTLWAWGDGVYGKLGNNSVISRSSPVQTISAGTNWKQVSAGWCFTVATKTDGTLWLWGSNLGGRLADHSSTDRSSPVQTVSGGTNWRQASAGRCHGAAIKNDGTLWTWGAACAGRLGDESNFLVNMSSPVQTVSGGTNWFSVKAGVTHSAAIKTDGTLWLWGFNGYGNLGINTITIRTYSSPMQTMSGGTNWKFAEVGSGTTFALKDEG